MIYRKFTTLFIFTPNDKQKCMSIHGNRTSMNDCEDTHRFDSYQLLKNVILNMETK